MFKCFIQTVCLLLAGDGVGVSRVSQKKTACVKFRFMASRLWRGRGCSFGTRSGSTT